MSIRIFHIEKRFQKHLGQVRHLAGCWVAEQEDFLWLKYQWGKGEIPLALQQLPAKARYRLEEEGWLFPVQGLTPIGKLPKLDWLPIAAFVTVELPTAALPGVVKEPSPANLIRSEQLKESHYLLLSWKRWKEYALQASNLRLAPLSFAVSARQEALIYGYPLPPLPGQLFWEEYRILLPAGWAFEHAIMAQILSVTQLEGKEEILLYPLKNECERLARTDFQPASRSAIRNTQKYLETRSNS